MGERVRHHIALSLLLQAVIADRRGGAHRGLDVARLDQLPLLVGARRPDAGEAIGLQLDAHLQAVRLGLGQAALRCCTLGRMPSWFCT